MRRAQSKAPAAEVFADGAVVKMRLEWTSDGRVEAHEARGNLAVLDSMTPDAAEQLAWNLIAAANEARSHAGSPK